MKHKTSLFAGITVSVVLGVSLPADAQKAGADISEISTPPGITLVDVTTSAEKLLWRRLGNRSGKPLYTYDQDGASGKATCAGECAKEFPPLTAPKNAKAFGPWTLVTRDGGEKQWAYYGQPLYVYSGEDPTGELPSGRDIIKDEDAAGMDLGSKRFSPKSGWKRAAYTPEKSVTTPAGISLESLAVANGYGFVIPGTGMVTYILKSAPKNPRMWTPVYAPGAARPMGDFTIVAREDGTRQWAFKNQLLYTYNGDYSPGDINGTIEQKDARVALVYEHFTPRNVKIDVLAFRGPLMTTDKGLTLYSQSQQKLQYGGRQTRGGYRYSYNDAKTVGTRGCVGECLEFYKPLLAPNDAQPSGFWEVETRPDGSKQWSYRGSPLYTYAEDKEPGDIKGNNRHQIVYGDPEGKTDLSLTGGDLITQKSFYGAFGSGFYWHTVGLFN